MRMTSVVLRLSPAPAVRETALRTPGVRPDRVGGPRTVPGEDRLSAARHSDTGTWDAAGPNGVGAQTASA